jgi:hypothetical protein
MRALALSLAFTLGFAAPTARGANPQPRREARSLTALKLTLGGGATSRHFDYTDDLFGALRNYELDSTPMVFLRADWYPLAHDSRGDLAHFGVTGGYDHLFPPTSLTRDGRRFDTQSNALFAGLRARVPIEDHELGFIGGYGRQRFEVKGDEAAPLVPDVAYEYLRIAAEAELRVSEFLFGIELGKRFVLATGELETKPWFPHVSPDAVDLRGYVGHAIVSELDLMVGVQLTRYFFSMNPQPDDLRVAGGAVDQYLSGWAAIAWRLPGSSGPQTNPTEEQGQ